MCICMNSYILTCMASKELNKGYTDTSRGAGLPPIVIGKQTVFLQGTKQGLMVHETRKLTSEI